MYVSIIALAVSVSSFILSIFAYQRSGKTVGYDYSPMLQIDLTKVYFGDRFRPEARLVWELHNKGTKPVRIDWVSVICGKLDLSGSSQKFGVSRGFIVAAGESKSFSFKKDFSELVSVMTDLGIDVCEFEINTEYKDINGAIKILKRPLGGFTWSDGVATVTIAAGNTATAGWAI